MRDNVTSIHRLLAAFLAFLKLGRIQFLAGGFVLYGLGVAIALYSGATINWKLVLWGQIIVTATQSMVHYGNDYYDFQADQNNLTPTVWSGGSRVLQAGLVARRTALIAAIMLAFIAVAATLLLVLSNHVGPLTVYIGLLAIILSWEYSAPPLRLHSNMVGEISGTFVVAGLTPLLGFYLQAGQITALPLLAILPLCCLQFNMLLSVHNPDVEGDIAVGKRTLVVRLGRPTTARLYLALLALAYALLVPLMLLGLPSLVAVCFSLSAPLAVWLGWHVLKGDWIRPTCWGRLAFFSIALLMSAAIFELVGFIWLSVNH